MLSIITAGRNDDYGEFFIERFAQSLNTNINNLEKNCIDFEYIVVDYNPLNSKYLYKDTRLQNLLSHDNVFNIIVDNSVILSENLYPTTFYEYFAKNIGAIKAKYNNLFFTNCDIILPDKLIKEINAELTFQNINDFFYRCRYREEVHLGQTDSFNIRDLHVPGDPDEPICGLYSGDTMLITYKNFIRLTGYNETNSGHKTEKNQASMDGEFLWNCISIGLQRKFFNSPYLHINHQHNVPRDSEYSKESYRNNKGWGASDYNVRFLNKNTIIIYH